jgi:predicted kinase
MTNERTEKFADARSCAAAIELHVFQVDYDVLWQRLRERNAQAGSADFPMTEEELRWAWSIFQPLSAQELEAVDSYTVHAGGLD